jgi:hypothetical protein
MPYKSEKIKIAGTQYDRRVKLTEDQRNYIRWLRAEEQLSYNKLAQMFNVSKRLIIFVCRPETMEKCRERFKQLKKEGRYKASKEEWAETMREHRNYKQNLYKDNKIE